jgi:glycosyltransferase involved in cell wall biosynthesis
MKRVLHVNDYPPDALGGAEVVMTRTAELLRAAGYDVRTFTAADLPDRRLSVLRYLDNRVARRALHKVLDTFRPAVVHLHNYYHLLSPGVLAVLAEYKRATAARVVMTAHDYHLVCPNSGGNWFRNGPRAIEADRVGSWRDLLFRRWDHRGWPYSFLKVAQHVWHYRLRDRRRVIDLVLCPSRFLQNLVTRVGLRTVHVPLPNPPPGPPAGPRPTRLTITFAGRIEPEKGLIPFLRGVRARFAGRIQIVGDGAERGRVEEFVKARGIADEVTFLGRRPHAETLRLIAESHVVLLPSLVLENYPLSLIEALAAGTNVLASDLGGMREIVTDSGVGYLFTPGDADQVADRLDRIAADHASGTLNAFDASAFLAGRDERAYRDAVVRAYEQHQSRARSEAE